MPPVVHAEVTTHGETVATVVGDVDALTVETVRARLAELPAPPDVLDMRFVSFITAAGVTLLVELHRERRLRVTASVNVERVLHICGLRDELAVQQPVAPPWLHDAPFGVAVHDDELRFVYVNDALAAINGVAAGAHHGQRPTELFAVIEDPISPVLEQVLRNGLPARLDVQGTTVAGTEAAWHCTYWPARYRLHGRVQRAVVAVVRARSSDAAHGALLSFELDSASRTGATSNLEQS